MRRARIKIHEAEATTTTEDGQAEREIEFMPPREVPLPDYPDEWPHDRTYPQFEGRNLTKGWWVEFAGGKDGEEEELSDFEEKLKVVEARQKQERKKGEMQTQLVKKSPAPKTSALQKTARDPLTSKAPSTLKAKSAASLLSHPVKQAPTTLPSFAAPTTTSKSRAPALVSGKKSSTLTQPAVGNPRHAAARVASNSTLGYSKGRAVSSGGGGRKVLERISDTHGAGARNESEAPRRTALDDLFMETAGLDVGDGALSSLAEDDDALCDFQFEPVEL